VYEVRITPESLRHLKRLPEKIRDAALTALKGTIRENPPRLGTKLVGELDGLYSARRGDYRIIYDIIDDPKMVVVHRIQHRAEAYRSQ
jgi:mRNA-degrading endonuclease RelE of RelBE toxin-antitoxin system